jgi:uncharacterized membrane protein YhaH (DUF805 family)
MTFFQSVRSALTKYATFSGRACRSEFWWFLLFSVLVGAVATVFDMVLGTWSSEREIGAIEFLARMALLLPSTAVAIRRLHDVGWSGWWLLTIVLPVFMAFVKGDDGQNDYGPNPLGEVRPGGTGQASDIT